MFPWIPFLKASGKRLSDIEYLSIKEFDGKRVDVTTTASLTLSATSTETDLVTQTANTGKDMYLGEASFEIWDGGSASVVPTIRLYINGVVKETSILQLNVASTNAYESRTIRTFSTKGLKVATGQIIKITVQNDGTASKITHSNGKLVLWEEDTGASPQV